jgi:hypothetical protein
MVYWNRLQKNGKAIESIGNLGDARVVCVGEDDGVFRVILVTAE